MEELEIDEAKAEFMAAQELGEATSVMPPEGPARIQRSSASYQRVLYVGPMAMTARPSRAVGWTADRRLPAVSRGYTVTRSAGTTSSSPPCRSDTSARSYRPGCRPVQVIRASGSS
jgi:hypothetical protein